MHHPSHASHPRYPHAAPQRGAAILLAMLIMVLVTTLVAGAVWRQSQILEMEAAERDRAQADWVLNGLLDWARIIIREDDRPSSSNPNPKRVDYLDEPWAKKLKASSLSTFLSLDKNDNGGRDTSDLSQAYFSGYFEDLNSRFNLPDLLADDLSGYDPNYGPVFDRLCALVGVAPADRDAFKAAYLRAAQIEAGKSGANTNAASGAAGSAGGSGSNTQGDTLLPERIEQLSWLGASSDTINKLSPYLVIFSPTRIDQPHLRQKINVNTADATLLKAAIVGCDDNCAQQIRQLSLSPSIKGFDSPASLFAQSAFSALQAKNPNAPIDGKSQLFQVVGKLQIDKLQVEETAVFWRPSVGDVRVYSRQRSALGSFAGNSADQTNDTSPSLDSSPPPSPQKETP